MKKAGFAVLYFVAMVVLLGELHVSEAVTCNASELNPCLPAITSGNAPSAVCCSKLQEQKPCLCGYLKDPTLKQYVNSPNAQKVVNSCGVPTPRRNLVGKVDFQDPGSLTSTSPGRFLHGEDDGDDRSGMVKKSTTLTITNRVTDVYDGRICQDNMISYEGKSKSGRSKFDEKCATPDEAKKNIIFKKVAARGISRESSKGKSQLKLGGLDGSDSRLDVMKSLDKKNHLQSEHSDKRLSKKLYSGKGDRVEVNGSGKSHSAANVQIELIIDHKKNNNDYKILVYIIGCS
ncbi:non-specific lipid-transfer protein 2-like [Forsythia ovata]|uniref:Non-specific lipid-transfer protein 2-like n=1 Tax=Forsythia ovata TaxID=205694 RepID=A0ABD1US83_9LAMI